MAGGHGALSFELINLNNIASTVVDPRPLKTARYQRRLMVRSGRGLAALACLVQPAVLRVLPVVHSPLLCDERCG